MTLSPRPSNFNLLTITNSGLSSASVSGIDVVTSTSYGRGDAVSSFTITTPIDYLLTISFTPAIAISSPSGNADAKAAINYLFYGQDSYGNYMNVDYGYDQLYDSNLYPQHPTKSGYNYAEGVYTGGFATDVTVEGTLSPGTYHFSMYSVGTSNANGQIASASASALGTFTLELGPINAVPEPGSLALLGIGAMSLAGAWWRKRRHAA